MYQAAVVHADVDKAAEIDHVQNRAGQFHALRQVFQLDYAAFEHRGGQILAGIAPGRANCARMSFKVSRPTSNSLASASEIDLGNAFGQGRGGLLVAQIGRRAVQPLQHAVGHG